MSTILVNKVTHAPRTISVVGLLERLNETEKIAVAKLGSAREWMKAAEVSHGYLAAIRKQLQKESTDTREERLRRLAVAAGVSPMWLVFGEGRAPKGSGPSRPDDPYPERAVIIPLLRGFSSEEIESLRTVRLKEHERLTEAEWIIRAKEIRKLSRLAASAIDENDEALDERADLE